MIRTAIVALALSCLLISCGGGGGGDGSSGGGGTSPAPIAQYYPGTTAIPTSGPEVADVATIDDRMKYLIRLWNVPGAAIAISKNGQLILARGYGYADFDAKLPVQPDSMFRIASLSKLLTSLAILRLRDQGQLDLDQMFLNILSEYQLPANADARLRNITIRNLLQHAGGWDRDAAGDPYDRLGAIARAQGVSLPVPPAELIKYMLGQPLQFEPGSRFAYSNFGYGLLGAVIAKVSGQSYENYVRDQVLAPLGVHAMSIGRPQLAQRGPFEVKYYTTPTQLTRDSELGAGSVAAPYSLDMFLREASGAWIGSAVDYTRIMAALDGSGAASGFLSADSRAQLFANPQLPRFTAFYSGAAWYGFGVEIGPTPATYGHTGANPGTATVVVHTENGYTFTALANVAMGNSDLANTILQTLATGIAGSSTDLYSQFQSPSLQASRP